jgi:hypothetical protein
MSKGNGSKKPQQKPSLESFQEEIRKEVFKQRTVAGKPGNALSDWLQAEKDIKKKGNYILDKKFNDTYVR